MNKPGWKTTEFWVPVFALLAIAIGWISGKIGGDTATWATAVAAGCYAISRGLAKGKPSDDALRQTVLAALAGRINQPGTAGPLFPGADASGTNAPGADASGSAHGAPGNNGVCGGNGAAPSGPKLFHE